VDFGIFFVNVGPFAQPEPFSHLVVGAERVGFESAWTVEHVVIPVGYKSTYPYDPSGKLPMPENTDLPDPLLPLAFAAGQTERIKFGTGILILPQRHPLYTAKEAATLDVLSNGRFILGIGIGWMKDEFDALGIPFAERAGRTDETIQAMRSLWTGEPEAFNGKYFQWGPLEMNPKPARPGGVPIVVGGHSEAAARRAARFGDGFFPGVFSVADLVPLLDVMRDECRKIGRNPEEIEITAALATPDLDLVHQFEDAGVSRLAFGYGAQVEPNKASIDAFLEGFGDAIISQV
jgi:probable F420-dependent oxidoreductase